MADSGVMEIASLYDKALYRPDVEIVALPVVSASVAKLRIFYLQNRRGVITDQHANFVIYKNASAYCQFSALKPDSSPVSMWYSRAGKFDIFYDDVVSAYDPNGFLLS